MFCSVCSLLDGVRSSASDCIQVCRCAETFRACPRFCALKRNIRLDLPVPLAPSTNRVSPTSSRSGCACPPRSESSGRTSHSSPLLHIDGRGGEREDRRLSRHAAPRPGLQAMHRRTPARESSPRAAAGPCLFSHGRGPIRRSMVVAIGPGQPPACPSHTLPGRVPKGEPRAR